MVRPGACRFCLCLGRGVYVLFMFRPGVCRFCLCLGRGRVGFVYV